MPGWTNVRPSGKSDRSRPETIMTRCRAVAGHEARGEAGAHEAAECRDAEGETVLPGREVVLAQQEDGQERGGGHDQAADQDRVEEQAPQHAVAEDEPPAAEKVGSAEPGGPVAGCRDVASADAEDPERGQQVAEGVGHDSDDRAEQPYECTTEGRARRRCRPARALESPVRHKEVIATDEILQIRAGRGSEGDARGPGDDRDDQQLAVRKQAEDVRDRDTRHRGEPDQVHRDHHRTLGPVPDPRPERERNNRRDGKPGGLQERHGECRRVQHSNRDQRERAEGNPRTVCTDGVGRPQPAETAPQLHAHATP